MQGLAGLLGLALLAAAPASAGVQFENCQPTADGGLTCDTQPTGNTLLNDVAARDGLFNAASPGWYEFAPDQDLDEEMGDTSF